jgi:desulfoferrodoxin (superoxide reductase-like protein)
MTSNRMGLLFIPIFMVILTFAGTAFADKASVSIEAPADVAKGSEITIRLTVTHSANSYFHHVEWLKVWVNNQELTRWEYSASKRPEEATFTKEIKYKVDENVEIKAEASCNIHGSKGPATWKVTTKE